MGTINAINIATGAASTVLTGNGVGVTPTFQAIPASGDVTAAANLTDDFVITGDGGAKGVQTSTLKISAAGQTTNENQPAFLATGGAVNNVLGQSVTSYSLGTSAVMTEVYDIGNNFSVGSGAGTSATFTAPITGKYQISLMIQTNGYVASTEGNIQIVTSNRTYIGPSGNVKSMQGTGSGLRLTSSFLCDMDNGDVAFFSAGCGGEAADIVDIIQSVVTGILIC